MKVAIVHLMRTGVGYVLEEIRLARIPLLSSWHQGLLRDWTRDEMFLHLSSQCGVLHNHVVGWDGELAEYAKTNGWTLLAVARDPCDQLLSLYRYLYDGNAEAGHVELSEYIGAQLSGRMLWGTHHFWAVPKWCRLIDEWYLYSSDMFTLARERFGVATPRAGRQNVSGSQAGELSSEDTAMIRSSKFNERYRSVVQLAKKV